MIFFVTTLAVFFAASCNAEVEELNPDQKKIEFEIVEDAELVEDAEVVKEADKRCVSICMEWGWCGSVDRRDCKKDCNDKCLAKAWRDGGKLEKLKKDNDNECMDECMDAASCTTSSSPVVCKIQCKKECYPTNFQKKDIPAPAPDTDSSGTTRTGKKLPKKENKVARAIARKAKGSLKQRGFLKGDINDRLAKRKERKKGRAHGRKTKA